VVVVPFDAGIAPRTVVNCSTVAIVSKFSNLSFDYSTSGTYSEGCILFLKRVKILTTMNIWVLWSKSRIEYHQYQMKSIPSNNTQVTEVKHKSSFLLNAQNDKLSKIDQAKHQSTKFPFWTENQGWF
jgi:hypothetical protein